MPRITKVIAREVLDSRGNPTVQAEVFSEKGWGRATAPSGASTGVHEALELRDGGSRYGGKGVTKAIASVNGPIAKALFSAEASDQRAIDALLCDLDGTPNKSRLGANATTAVSLAVAQCAASEEGVGLYRIIARGKKPILPSPMMNVINGGKHAGSGLSIQEFMIFPIGFQKFSEALRAGSEIYHSLGELIAKKYGKQATGLGDEGGFAPPCKTTGDALDLLESATEDCGYLKKVKFAIDSAASSFFEAKSEKYLVDGKKLSAGQLSDFYVRLAKEYPLESIEDPFEEEAFDEFAALHKRLSGKVQLVGDDIFVTSLSRLKRGIATNSASALLLKVNQVGTLTEALDAAELCRQSSMGVVVSHRSGETEDTSIADIATGIACGQIKTGSLARAERTAKYNRLLQIEDELPPTSFAAGSKIAKG